MSTETHKKQFEGWLIPDSIITAFENKVINATELIVLREIDSLSNCAKGCYAGNKYLGKMAHVGLDQVGVIIRRLKEIGLVEQWKTNGRRRWLRSVRPTFGEQEQHPFHTERPEELQGHQREMEGDQFTGWYIPKEIVEIYRGDVINIKELLLLANINNLSKTEDGCYASNAYLGKQLHISDERVRQYLVHLKELGLVKQSKSGGRNRKLYTCFGNEPQKESHNNPQENPVQTIQENPVQVIQENPALIIQVKDNTRKKNNLSTKVDKRQAAARRRSQKPAKPFSSDGSKQVSKVVVAPRGSEGLLSLDIDKQAAAELRSILIEKDSDLLRINYSRKGQVSRRAVTLDTLTKVFFRLRTERQATGQDIFKALTWLRENWDEPYAPKIRTASDLFDKWELFRDAQKRSINGNGKKGGIERMTSSVTRIIEEMEVVK